MDLRKHLTLGLAALLLPLAGATDAHAADDTTAPPAPVNVVVSPRVVTAPRSAAVTGDAYGSSLVVAIGGVTTTIPLSGSEEVATAFDTGQLDLSAEPRAQLPVQLTWTDASNNQGELALGTVDNRWDSVLPAPAVSPTSFGWGQTTTVTGRLTRLADTGTAGHLVQLKQRRGDVLVAVGSVVTTAGGWFTKTLALKTSGPLLAVFAGDASQRARTSGPSTALAVAGPSNPADQPGSVTAARLASAVPLGLTQVGRLASGSDVDVFPFAVTTAGVHRVVLGRLPLAARLDVVDRGGHVRASSDAAGRQFEEIIVGLTPGTYFARVVSHGGGSSSSYRLTPTRLVSGLNLLSKTVLRTDGYPQDQYDAYLELYNNSAAPLEIHVYVDCVTASNNRVRREDWIVTTARARSRVFGHVFTSVCPEGSSVRLLPRAVPATLAPLPKVSLAPGRPFRMGMAIYYPFTLTNKGTTRSRALEVQVGEYTADGVLRGTVSTQAPSLAPGASYSTRVLGLSGGPTDPNRVRWLLVG